MDGSRYFEQSRQGTLCVLAIGFDHNRIGLRIFDQTAQVSARQLGHLLAQDGIGHVLACIGIVASQAQHRDQAAPLVEHPLLDQCTLGHAVFINRGANIGHQTKLDDYVSTTAFIMRLFIFILVGAQVDFGLMGQYLTGGIIVVTVLMLVARPVTVFACALPDRRARWSVREMLFMCWTRETGVIPGALAGLLLGMKAPGAQMIASVTFIAILMTILIQAPTTKWLGKRLGLLEKSER